MLGWNVSLFTKQIGLLLELTIQLINQGQQSLRILFLHDGCAKLLPGGIAHAASLLLCPKLRHIPVCMCLAKIEITRSYASIHPEM